MSKSERATDSSAAGFYGRMMAASAATDHSRTLEDGHTLHLQRMLFTWRLSLVNRSQHLEDFWCYQDRDQAVAAFQSWAPSAEQPEPPGWTKHKATGRCRVHGDPAKEWDANGPKPAWAIAEDDE